jgi:hypothetical protein
MAKAIIRILGRAGFPHYFSRYSNRVYDARQHVVLLALRQLEGKSYRRFMDWLRGCRPLLRLLNLRRVPHYTTLQKFAARVPSELLDRVLRGFASEAGRVDASFIIGVDASGFRPSKASSYYTRSLKPRRVRRYVKCTLAVELRLQLVCGFKARRVARHDVVDFRPVLEKARPEPGFIVVADKGYDAEHVHEYVREELGGYAVIPPRHLEVPIWRTRGRYRKEMKRGYSKKLYNQRSKDETVFSVVKRLMGEHLSSRLVRTQNRELALRLVAYNAHRLINIT